MTKNAAPTIEQVRRGEEQIEVEIAATRREYEAAAYDAASNTTDGNRAKLSEIRRKLGDLRAELEGIAAVRIEAVRRQRIAESDARLADIETNATEALAAVDAVVPAFERVYDQVLELRDSLGALLDMEAQANYATQSLHHAAGTNTGEAPFQIPRAYNLQALLDPLLWLALHRLGELNLQRTEAVMDVGGRECPERTKEAVHYSKENASTRIRTAASKLIAAENERRAAGA